MNGGPMIGQNCSAMGVFYAWLCIGDVCVYVADIEADADEKAITHQIYAKGMGWA